EAGALAGHRANVLSCTRAQRIRVNTCRSRRALRKKLPHGESDLLDVCLKCEVSRIQKLHRRISVISPVSLRTGGGEERIVLPPDCEQRWLWLAEILLERWGGCPVVWVVEKKINTICLFS